MSTQSALGPPPAAPRASIRAFTLRGDRWWAQPVFTFAGLMAFIIYSTYAAIANRDYYHAPYLSPFYSPCVSYNCGTVPGSAGAPHVGIFGTWWIITPAVIILIFPLAFRLTCYYYRKAYYRSFWLSPPACAVAEPHGSYSGETRFPLILQNIHRYSLYFAVLVAAVLTYDTVIAFRDPAGQWGHMGLGTVIFIINASLIWAYTAGCHSCRHLIGGRINHFSRHPTRYWMWSKSSWFNARHMQFAWLSLFWVAFTDFYVRLLAAGVIHDPRFF